MRNFFLLLTISFGSCGQQTDKIVGDPCNRCDAMFEGMPSNLSWDVNISEPQEPGEPLLIRGTIFRKDGKTPAPNVILYVYHTDNTGHYSTATNQTQGKLHGHLRGWMKTDARGRYQFRTIRPASYPNRKAPRHIHPLIKEPGLTLYFIDEYLFDDDPLLTAEERNKQQKYGGSGIIRLTRNINGTWEGQRDIILGMNISNY